MARAVAELPSMLAAVTGGVRRVELSGGTMREALEDLFEKHPELRVHILDERGTLRQHVLCFLNGGGTRWEETEGLQLNDGDRITVLQAVSGG